jgi:hypothetical protein
VARADMESHVEADLQEDLMRSNLFEFGGKDTTGIG